MDGGTLKRKMCLLTLWYLTPVVSEGEERIREAWSNASLYEVRLHIIIFQDNMTT